MLSKVCTKCLKDKPVDQYSKDKNRKDGLQYWCKACWVEVRRGRKEKDQAYRKTYYAQGASPNTRTLIPNPSYHGMHSRLKGAYGSASNYTCTCGAQARDWSYNGCDDERMDHMGMPYCVHLEHYEPLCKPCHLAKDSHSSVNSIKV